MNHFASYDATEIGFRTLGEGRALVCLPGGPGRSVEYLGDLGGLASSRYLVLPDTRGTGASQDAADPETYRCDRLVGDVEGLHAHLGFERIDLLGHSAAASLAVLYAAAHPDRIDHLVLLTPSLAALGVEVTDDQEREAINRRSEEPWYAEAAAAADKAVAGDRSPDNLMKSLPFLYGRWDDRAQMHTGLGISYRARKLWPHFNADGVFDPPGTVAALAELKAPVLIYGGEFDLIPVEALERAAQLFPNGQVMVQPGAGHFPWLDDPARFTAALSDFLG